MRKVLKNEDIVVIHGWMRKELGLKGNALMIYAIIYGYSQTEGTDYAGGYRYLSEFTGSDRSTVQRVIKKMVEDGILTKEDEQINGNILPHFRAVRGLR